MCWNMEERTLAKTPRSQSMDENGIGKKSWMRQLLSTVSLVQNSWNLFIMMNNGITRTVNGLPD